MPEALDAKERQIADQSFSSAAPYEQVAAIIGLPDDVRGLTIVDIGAGASSSVAELNRRGAVATAIDPAYARVNRLVRSVQKYLKPDQVGNPSKFRRQTASLQEFEKDFQRNRDRYLAGFAGELPFNDNSIDIVYSQLAVSFFLGGDRDVLTRAVNEALRVLKPAEEGIPKEKRSIIFQPWINPRTIDNRRQPNMRAVEASLRDRGISFFIETIDPQISPRIRIVKPSQQTPTTS